MSYISNRDFLIEVAKGLVPGHESFHVTGVNTSVGTLLVPLTSSGTWQTPTSDVALMVNSDNANDTSGGTGARTVVVEGCDISGSSIVETVTMNGTTNVNLSNSFARVTNFYVATSGTYATSINSSHKGNIIVVDQASGRDIYAKIFFDGSYGIGYGESKIGVNVVPVGYTDFIIGDVISIESNKPTDTFFFVRDDYTDVTAPYVSMNLRALYKGTEGLVTIPHGVHDKLTEGTEYGFLAAVDSGSGSVSVDLEILRVDNSYL